MHQRMLLSTYAQRHPVRAVLLVALVIVLADWSADDGCDCTPKELRQRPGVASAQR